MVCGGEGELVPPGLICDSECLVHLQEAADTGKLSNDSEALYK